jgi:dienelactone hydrolase
MGLLCPRPVWGDEPAASATVRPAAAKAVAKESSDRPKWDLAALGKAPRFSTASSPTAKDVASIFYDGPVFQKKPTKTFAYYGLPKNLKPGEKVPGIVLIHGGGGTAFDAWVRLWNSRGYAAIAPDLCGCVPVGTYGNWQRHAAGGPPGWGGFDQLDWPAEDQWTWQAVANIMLANSLLRGLPEVDASRIGMTGISWGGYLTCVAAGVDLRFQFAVPVYGCGFLGDNSAWLPEFAKMPTEKSARWLRWWDPSCYLPNAKLPMLWVNGTNDFAYPMDSWQKSYRSPEGTHTLCLRLRMPHGHGGAGENPEEIRAFAESVVRGQSPLARITGQSRDGDQVAASYASQSPIRSAELNYARQTGKWQDRKWETTPARVDGDRRRVVATLPSGVKVYYLNLIDARGLVVSTEHVMIE